MFLSLHYVFSSKPSPNNNWFNDVRGWSIQYCNEHWHSENINWNVLSVDELFKMLNGSSYYNPLNTGLFKFIADKSGDVFLVNSVKNYEKRFSCVKIEDLNFIKEITVIGNNISESESTLIVKTLLDNKVTIGQLCNLCTPRVTDYNVGSGDFNTSTLILDATEALLEFYHSVKVCFYKFVSVSFSAAILTVNKWVSYKKQGC